MSPRRAILPAFFTFILLAVASAGQPSLTPQAGVLVLRNGQVLHGQITRAGDYYVVIIGPSSEIRLKAEEVEIACRDLEEAYLHRLQRMDPTALNQRISLAEWCLRNGLLDYASEQLDLAEAKAGDSPQIKSLRERLKFAREPKATAAPVKTVASIATISPEQLEKTLRELPDGSVERFSAIVQPILLNGCAANNCHGPMARNEFQLLKPASGQVANQRFSQRNLYSALKFVDRNDPLSSPLLLMPQKRHGGASGPIFDERTKAQLYELTQWVKLVTTPKAAPVTVGTIDPGSSLLAADHRPQTDGTPQPPKVAANPAEPKDRFAAASTATAEQPESVKEAAKPSPDAPYVARDPFDPEVFNRRFHRKR